jgi:hypothetical protein
VYWEPWTPKVGDRVRVRLSPECRHERQSSSTREMIGSHIPEENGRVGTVAPWPNPTWPRRNGHDICVVFDVPIAVTAWRHFYGCAFAAIELVPLDAER